MAVDHQSLKELGHPFIKNYRVLVLDDSPGRLTLVTDGVTNKARVDFLKVCMGEEALYGRELVLKPLSEHPEMQNDFNEMMSIEIPDRML